MKGKGLNMRDNNFPEKGTREYHVIMLKKVQRWLQFMVDNPKPGKNTDLVSDELEAVTWALKELGE